MPQIKPILSKIRRVRSRIRLQRAVNGAIFGLNVGGILLAVALVLLKTGLIGAVYLDYLIGLVAAPIIGLCAGLFWPVSILRAAQLLDSANGLKDRLGSAVEFAQLPTQTEMTRLQVADALKYAGQADAGKAYPLQMPRFLRATVIVAMYGAAAMILYVANYDDLEWDLMRSVRKIHKRQVVIQTQAKKQLPDAEKKRLEEKIDTLKKEIAKTTDPELKKWLEQQLKILEMLRDGKLKQKDAFKMLAELEKKYKQFREKKSKGLKKLLERLAKLGKELQKDKQLKPLAEALMKKDLLKAEKELHKLAKTLKSDRQRKKLKSVIKKALTKTRSENEKKMAMLRKKMEKLRKQLRKMKDRLRRKQNKRLAERHKKEKNRLNRMKKQLERLSRDREFSEMNRKFLQRLTRNFDDPQDMMRRMRQKPMTKKQMQEYKDWMRRQKGLTKKELQQWAKMMKQLRKMQGRQKQWDIGRGRLVDIRDWLRRYGKKGWKLRYARMQDFDRKAGKGNKGKDGKPLFIVGKDGQRLLMLGKRGSLGSRRMLMPSSKSWGTKPGGDPLGKRTNMKRKKFDENFQEGKKDKNGLVKTQLVFDASRRGFSGRAYRRVYQNYKGQYEQKMSRQEIPKGYEGYVRRYMELIRPR